MSKINTVTNTKKLLKQTVVSFLLAACLLFLLVLPAEYGIDPTGLGKIFGLTSLSTEDEATQSVSNGDAGSAQPHQAGSSEAMPAAIAQVNFHDGPPTTRTIKITLKPFDEVEYKALLPKGEPIFYRWSVTSGDTVYVDFHGEPTETGFPEGYFQQYMKGEKSQARGSFTATFKGHHGWYWLNIGDKEIMIALEVTGYYESLEELYRGNQLQGQR